MLDGFTAPFVSSLLCSPVCLKVTPLFCSPPMVQGEGGVFTYHLWSPYIGQRLGPHPYLHRPSGCRATQPLLKIVLARTSTCAYTHTSLFLWMAVSSIWNTTLNK